MRGRLIKTIELGEDFQKGLFARIPDEPDTEVYGDTMQIAVEKFFEKHEADDIVLNEDD